MTNFAKLFAVSLLAVSAACSSEETAEKKPCDGVSGNCVAINAGASYETVQEAFINAKSGDTIAFGKGTFSFQKGLSLIDVDNVTIKGMGMSETVLSFAGSADADGVYSTGNNFVMHDITIQDAPKNNLKNEGAKGVTYRRVRSEWTGGPKVSNGAYAFYPVQCSDVLIEDSVSVGSADAGIYVGQSKNIIVRRNVAEYNVAGIEIENSEYADVYQNAARYNTGGILAFSLPTLQVKGSKYVRIFDNDIYENNTNNFAEKTSIVASVPTGTGVMVFAASDVEVFNNRIRDNEALGALVVSYLTAGISYDDPDYDPFPRRVNLHDNAFVGGGTKPGGTATGSERRSGDLDVLAVAGQLARTTLPDIVWDGYKETVTTTAKEVLCIRGNGDADFTNIDYQNDFENVSNDIGDHNCTFPSVPAAAIPGVE